MAIGGRFVALLAAGLVPLLLFGTSSERAIGLLGGWLALSLTLGVLDLALAASPRRVRFERSLPQRVRLGEQAVSVLAVTNLGTRALRAVVRDGWEPSAGAPRARTRLRVPPSQRRSVQLVLQPTRRGARLAKHVTVRSFGPLGLWARQATLAAPGRLLVLPPFNARKHLPSRLARLRELDGQTLLLHRGQGTEFDSLREYVRGDDVRSIDWRATARRHELVVRTWRPERDRRVVVLIDTGRLAAARVADETRLDTAIESALLLAALASKAGDRVDLVAFDRRVRARVQGVSGQTLLSRITEAMAPVEPQLIETDWSAAPGLVRGITTQRALVLVLTTLDSAAAARELLAVLPQLSRSHLVLVGQVTDPQLAEASRGREDVAGVYLAAAAERALLDRERVHEALRRQGADVVAAEPAALPPAIADRYLAYKQAGRL